MQAQTIIIDCRRELLETMGITWSDSELLRLLNRGELDYTNRTRILEDTAFLTLTQGRSDYPLPQNFLSVRLVLHDKPITNPDNTLTHDWKRVYPSNLEKIAQEQPNLLDDSSTQQDRPRKYFIWGRTLYIKPAPSLENSSTLYIWYKAKPIPLISTNSQINIDDSLSESLNAYILWKAWSKVKERDKADEQKGIYFGYVGEGRRWVKKASGDQRYRIDIDSPISFSNSTTGFNPLQP